MDDSVDVPENTFVSNYVPKDSFFMVNPHVKWTLRLQEEMDQKLLNGGTMTFEDRTQNLAEVHSGAHPNSQRFYELLLELAELHDRKQADYGRDDDPFANVNRSVNLGIEPWLGIILRMGDKFGRLESFAQKGELLNESVEDSLRDIAVYSLMALVLMEGAENL